MDYLASLRLFLEEGSDGLTLRWPDLSIIGALLMAVLLPASLAVRGKLVGYRVMQIMLADKDKQIDSLTRALASKDRTIEMQTQLLVQGSEVARTLGHVVAAIPTAVEATHEHQA